MGSESISMGVHIASVRPFATPVGERGVSVSYSDGECGNLQMVFKREPSALDQGPVQRDSTGVYHVPRLRLAKRTNASSEGVACLNITLEWPTAAACPLCRLVDYLPQATVCGPDGFQVVEFRKDRPCVSGQRPPPSYKQRCRDGETGGEHAASVMMMVIPLAVFLGVGFCCYAAYLHRRYGKYHEVRQQPGGCAAIGNAQSTRA